MSLRQSQVSLVRVTDELGNKSGQRVGSRTSPSNTNRRPRLLFLSVHFAVNMNWNVLRIPYFVPCTQLTRKVFSPPPPFFFFCNLRALCTEDENHEENVSLSGTHGYLVTSPGVRWHVAHPLVHPFPTIQIFFTVAPTPRSQHRASHKKNQDRVFALIQSKAQVTFSIVVAEPLGKIFQSSKTEASTSLSLYLSLSLSQHSPRRQETSNHTLRSMFPGTHNVRYGVPVRR
ncbi:hypothetical protein CTAM01_07994 [Colletotrichum tamarilloi]|uniref:Uncharacterized protein n=1 Tax=Colletotrichum tamarilloi TaxID=1209934 RepID=A0ABQ9R895_9PEZI|nr:uncharacterized protein CTAM01_07994 [Colletotrichum tamarilloi]KAK1497330.1 hypothetical protein CTAM01_07994 [Colletotrichum tamarilloi]